MTALVVGGGLIGLTTAWALQSRGEEVLLVDRCDSVAQETSFANAGLITPSMPEPWNGPGVFRHLLASLFNPRAGLRLKPSALPQLIPWGLRFIAHSVPGRHFAACTDNYRLAHYSLIKTQTLSEQLGLQYSRGTAGTLSVFRDKATFEAKRTVIDHVASLGMRFRRLDPAAIVRLVPGLRGSASSLICGVHFPDDHHGDAHRFCRELYSHFISAGGTARFGESVQGLLVDHGRIRGARLADDNVRADRVVIAAGSHSPALLAGVGLKLPVKPAKGYSVTVNVNDTEALPPLPVIDDALHVCLTPLGDRIRMVGTAEFAGFDLSLDPIRTDNLVAVFRRLLPELAETTNLGSATRWAGLRPMSYDGRPFIGATGVEGLYVSSGHGPLGWTMAMGSAELLADLIVGKPPAIDPNPYSVTRA